MRRRLWGGRAALGVAALALSVGLAQARQAAPGEARAASRLAFEHLGTGDGLSNESILAVTQDALGFVWVGTADGLDRLDGRTVRSFRADGAGEALSSNVVQALAPGGGGGVWVGTARGLDRYDPATERVAPVEGLAERDVLALVPDADGAVWVGTTTGLARVSPDGDVSPVDLAALPSRSVSALAVEGGRLWIGTGDGVASLDLASRALTRLASDGLGVLNVSSIVPSAAGGVLVGTLGEGLFRVDDAFTPVDLGGDLLGRVVSSVLEDTDGGVWVGTLGGGLRHLRPGGGLRRYRAQPGDQTSLVDDQVSALWEDRQGVLWVATYGGLDHADRARGTAQRVRADPEAPASLASDDVLALLAAGETLYVGTDRSLDTTTDGETFAHRTIRSGAPSELVQGVTALAQDRDGAVWVGTDGAGLLRLDGDALVPVGAIDGAPGTRASVTTLLADRAGRLWVGTVARGLFLYDRASDRAVRYTSNADGLASDQVEALAEAADGSIWVGTSGGLCRVDRAGDAGAFTCVRDSLQNAYVQALWAREDGSLYVGTRGGLDRLDLEAPDNGVGYGREDGLPGESVYGILEDGVGTLWLSTNGGLVQFEPVTGTVTRTLALGAGADRTLGRAMAIDERGRITVGGTRGLLVFDPENLAALNPNPPQVVLTDVVVEGQTVEPGPDAPLRVAAPVAERLDIDHDQTVLTLVYAGLHFSDAAQNRYRYRLDGFDEAWRMAGDGGARREVTYTNLDAGRYTFEVQAANADGVWSETPARLRVEVHPPWWRTLWAMVGFAGLVVVGLVRADRWQRARLLRRERERAERRETELRAATAEAERRKAEAEADTLKADAERQAAELERARQVQEANAKLAAANARLEASLADLQATQDQLVQSEKLASLGQLTAGIAHEIKNPLNFVNNFAELSVELAAELDEELTAHANQTIGSIRDNLAPILADLTDNARRIYEHGQRADRIVRAMLLHSRGGADEKVRVDLNAFVEEYANLAYHGAKASEADFQVNLVRDFGPRVGEADVVPQELGRVLINLLTNAFYAVQARAGEAAVVTVRTRRLGKRVAVEVQDNGTGMTEAVRARIFEPFFTTKPTGEGTGLGLSLAHDIVTGVHGGEMHVESTLGQGTVVRMQLPAAPPLVSTDTAGDEA